MFNVDTEYRSHFHPTQPDIYYDADGNLQVTLAGGSKAGYIDVDDLLKNGKRVSPDKAVEDAIKTTHGELILNPHLIVGEGWEKVVNQCVVEGDSLIFTNYFSESWGKQTRLVITKNGEAWRNEAGASVCVIKFDPFPERTTERKKAAEAAKIRQDREAEMTVIL